MINIYSIVANCKNECIFKYIIDNIVDLEYEDAQKYKIVHHICMYSTPEMIKYIIDKEVELESCPTIGWKVIHCVSYYSTFETIKYVIDKRVDLDSTINRFNGRDKNYNVIDLIKLNKKLDDNEIDELIDFLKEKKCKFAINYETVHQSNRDIIDQIMEQKNYKKLLKYNDFNFELFNKNTLITFLKSTHNLETIKYVIDNTLNVQGIGSNGYYPMHEICKCSFPEAIKYAIDKGWSLEVSCETGYRPMHFIFRYQEPELIKQVLDMNIDLNAAGGDGWSPIHYLCRYSTIEMVKYILEKGVDVKSDLVKLDGEPNNYSFEDNMKRTQIINDKDRCELLDLIQKENCQLEV